MYATPTFITEVLCFITCVQLNCFKNSYSEINDVHSASL